MAKSILVALLVLILPLTSVTSTWTSTKPVGGCPVGFELHPADAHDDHHEHQHVGTSTDRNGDGLICVKHLANSGIHVHVDNTTALPRSTAK